MRKVLAITGPTAVGKTALSIYLAEKFNGEIVSGDSMQVYRQLDIGTAKVTEQEKKSIPHYLIDCREITESYSAADFQCEGRKYIEEITAKGKLPIIVGGTGLYIQALLYDFQLGGQNEPETSAIREKYEEYAEKNSNEALWQLLKEKDLKAAEVIHFNNRKKVIRALEVFETTGYSITSPKEKPKPVYDYFLIGLETEREILYARINQRVELMMEQGLLREAKLMAQNRSVQAAQGIGYKEFFPYFDQQLQLEEAVDQVKQNSRRYAKRQLTWFKNRMTAHWIDLVMHPEKLPDLERSVAQWLDQ
ncbi:tRNA (adenosine(37)-N6)-dimethylallyltransferase MiaA [Enterococcus sp. BWT-B8]|uniref:tRNA (adenosine(37)-N6)-dimethylallyltransferase MiaA n=1 Tax=Enterococcus sp. BWT-B8 TaxID=2885157 RepID=UPI001E60B6E2|nr:tRNA (adenosine(37)-N6)-dimethylallyltransferase MiaA [Enterococcus sp. BWT-B8]MCB5953247.1 tRNA (adenosine(37)-N6)-dimethylallyltransferase MiaA [Enterococcus sp. BWT-B8]